MKIKKHKSFLHLMSNTSPKQRKALIKTMCQGQLEGICEVMLNLLNGVIPVPPNIKKKLEPYKPVIRLLADRAISLARKRNFLGVNNGGSTVGKVLNYLLPKVLDSI